MKRLLLVALIGCQQRTELMVGIATDVRAPDAIDGAELIVTRADNGVTELDVQWSITGVADQPFNLPGSYGVFSSDGTELPLDLVLVGTKGNTTVVTRHAVLGLINGQTLFYRMGITAGCAAKTDCAPTQTCVEGTCQDPHVDPRTLPAFTDDLVASVACNSGTAFIDTATGQPMPEHDNGDCPAGLCSEGTCFNPPPPPDPTQTRTISGTSFTTFIQPTKTTTRPDDVGALTPIAILPDGTTVSGTGMADGTFAIPNVPEGPYTLGVGSTFVVTDKSAVDLSADKLGRPDSVPVTQLTTGFDLSVLTNLAATTPTDFFEAYSADIDTWWFDFGNQAGPFPIATNTTTLNNYLFDDTAGLTSNQGNPRLVQNDDFIITQLHAQTSPGGVPFQAAVRTFIPPHFAQTDGGTTTLMGNMVDATPPAMLASHVAETQWDNAVGFDGTNATKLNPRAVPFVGAPNTGVSILVLGVPGGLSFGNVGATADFLFVNLDAGKDTTLDALPFATPLVPGETWGFVIDATTNYEVDYLLPGTMNPARVNVRMGFEVPLSAAPDPMVPLMGPVTNVTLDGNDLFAPMVSAKDGSTVAWNPPAIGAPRRYVVEILHLTVNGMRTVQTFQASITTAGTSVQIPPGQLVAGERYAITITAESGPTVEAPNRTVLPNAFSKIASGIVAP